MKNLKITKGECFYKGNPQKERMQSFDIFVKLGKTDYRWIAVANFPDLYSGADKESEANAILITDAFNAANKCGKLPSELLAERDELLSALRSCVLSMQAHPDCEENSEFEGFVNKGWDAINKTLSK